MSGTQDINAIGTTEHRASIPPGDCQTLVAVLSWRAEAHPELPAFTFLRDGECDEQTLSYRELHDRAMALAGRLAAAGAVGEPVLLVFEPGVDYVVAFFACLYAGAVAVPVYPPDPFRLPRTLPRLQAIVENAGARWLLTTSGMAQQTKLEKISGAALMLLDEPDLQATPTELVCTPGSPADLALLQYTSGSTGTPRGVVVSHGNLMHNFRAMNAMFDVPNAVVAHWLPPYHDMGLIGCLLLPIYSGRHTIAMSPLAFMQKPIRWLRAIDRYRATTSGAPNFGYELCVRKVDPDQVASLDLSSWRVAVTGAEPVRAATLESFTNKFAAAGFRPETFLPAFGMAEATLIVSGEHQASAPRREEFDLERLEANEAAAAQPGRVSRTLVGCGPAAEEVELSIVDPETRLRLGENRIGEIWLRSPGVGGGYWGDPRRTEEVFRATVANESPDRRYLRTGDMGFLRGGELFITGRRKELIIIGGRNLYPLDLEQAVQGSHPDLKVDGGAAFSLELDGDEKLVVVQEVLRPKKNDLAQLLRNAVQALVTEAGITPHALVLISAGSLPKTSSGKTRRGECRRLYLEGGLRVLAQWPLPDSAQVRDATPPVTEMEQQLAVIWEEVLGVERVGREDDFFLLGAKSLRVAAMLGRVAELLGFDVPLGVLFRHSTLHDFARAMEQLVAESAGGHADYCLQLEPLDDVQTIALTDSQRRFWALDRLGRSLSVGGTLHIPLRLDLQGALNIPALKQRLREIIARHDVLRTTFFEDADGEPRQRVHSEAELNWQAADLRAIGANSSQCSGVEAALETFERQLLEPPMDLQQAPLMRAGVARVGDSHWRVTLVLHHLIADGWSIGLLLRELGEADLSPPNAPGYSAYASWQSQLPPPTQKSEYWRRRLEGAPETLSLQTSDEPETGNGLCRAALDERLLAGIQHLARQFGATPFMVHLAAFQVVLSRYASSRDVLVSTVTANRARPVLENILGCFINTVALRGDLSGDPTFAQFMRHSRDEVIRDLEHADYPFERLVEDRQPRREPGRLSLVQALLLVQDMPEAPARVAGATVCDVQAGQAGISEFDIALSLEPGRDGWSAQLSFQRERMSASSAERFLESYLAVLQTVADSPQIRLSALPIPAKAERWDLLVDRNATDRQLVTNCPVAQLELAATKTPDAVAVRFDGLELTYSELHEQANQAAHWLQKRGAGPDVPVGIMMRRSPAMLAAMLATLKAGAAYVPLDPTHPPARLRAIANDCRPAIVVTDDVVSTADAAVACGASTPRDLLPSSARCVSWSTIQAEACGEPKLAPAMHAAEDHLAYIIYTSGTTGEPKGVMVTRRGVANFLQSFARAPGLRSDDRVLAHTTISFDISVLELFLPLTVGARVVLASCDTTRDPHALAQLIASEGVTFLQATPSGFRMLTSAGWRPRMSGQSDSDLSLKVADGVPHAPQLRLLCGGERLTGDLARDLTRDGAALWNVYGPTETTIWSTLDPVTDADSPTIGRPIDNTRVYVLDEQRRPAPMGVPGDLYLGGAGVARGYWRRDAMTAERFVPDEFQEQPGRMMYRTGDRVRWRADGRLDFLGRDDAQVKVRGFRIELGEVESALAEHPLVRECAVLCEIDAAHTTALVAYLVPDGTTTTETLREHLLGRLPAYMCPSEFVTLEQLPKSPAGKVDRRKLAESAGNRVQPSTPRLAPRTPLESEVADVWREVLQCDELGVHDDFFQIGGHSLKAMRVLSRLESRHAVALSVPEFFERPTIEALAQQLLLAIAARETDLESLLSSIEELSDEEARASMEPPDQEPPPNH
ncbi:MAG: amino acid adenylation domain-containing protein [Planctomycetales bacterium]|nr:amino acid adenylation domain-containing protein [Planctomycetales bacterium]